jgi:hypothetical protein
VDDQKKTDWIGEYVLVGLPLRVEEAVVQSVTVRLEVWVCEAVCDGEIVGVMVSDEESEGVSVEVELGV